MEPVQVERFYLGCPAHAPYMVASEGIAAIIDPQPDGDLYLEAAAGNGWKIEHTIETISAPISSPVIWNWRSAHERASTLARDRARSSPRRGDGHH